MSLLKSFRPNENLAVNLSYHIHTESQLKCLLTLAEEDTFYLQVYRHVCEIKYGGYQPNSYHIVGQRVGTLQAEY